jgi:uncharacterized protein DUF5681
MADSIYKQGKSREIGYGKPPKEHQFKKGQSGNPAGRPVATRHIISKIETLISEIDPSQQDQYARILACSLLHSFVKGDCSTIKEVIRFIDG